MCLTCGNARGIFASQKIILEMEINQNDAFSIEQPFGFASASLRNRIFRMLDGIGRPAQARDEGPTSRYARCGRGGDTRGIGGVEPGGIREGYR
jgi:hypothetical protein